MTNDMRSLFIAALLSLTIASQALAQSDVPVTRGSDPAEQTSAEKPEDGDGEPTAEQPVADESAQDSDGAKEEEQVDSGSGMLGPVADFFNTPPLGYLVQGGIFMWPLLLMGIIGAGVIIERYRSLKMLTSNSEDVRHRVREMLEAQQTEEAFELCRGEQGPVPAVLAVGLRKYLVLERLGYERAKIADQVVKAMDDYSVHIVAALERHLPILATISSAAPMLGFLGTVQGMIVAFDDIVLKMGEMNIVEAAASGIKVSLMTTCFGLIVGIPAFVAFNYFTSVINRFVLDVEESASELIETVALETSIADAPSKL